MSNKKEQPANADSKPLLERVILCDDNNNVSLSFTGKIFSEKSFFDEESESLTRFRLYATEDNKQVYSIVKTKGGQKQRRHYLVNIKNSLCTMSDGKQEITLPVDILFATVLNLCGVENVNSEDAKATFETFLRSATR